MLVGLGAKSAVAYAKLIIQQKVLRDSLKNVDVSPQFSLNKGFHISPEILMTHLVAKYLLPILHSDLNSYVAKPLIESRASGRNSFHVMAVAGGNSRIIVCG